MKLPFALLLMVFCPLQLSAQNKKELKNFLKLFPETSLPACYEYGDSALVWDEDYGIEIGLKEADSTRLLPENLVQKYLLKENESLFVDLGSDSAKYSFYALHLVAKTAKYSALTFERQYTESWHPFSEKFLITLDKNGKMISKEVIVSFAYGGTFLSTFSEREATDENEENADVDEIESGENSDQQSFIRLPYFARTSGCVYKNSIHLKSSQIPFDVHYQINKRGNIVKIK